MGQPIPLRAVFSHETLGPIRLDDTMRDVAQVLPPPEVWNMSA